MAQPYVGEIRIFAGNFAPAGWHFCDGTLLPISEYDTLFNLIGTTYGGDGQSTFAVPDLRGRMPMHMGTSGGTTYVIGEMAGVESVTLTTGQIPSHTHTPQVSASGDAFEPAGRTWSRSGAGDRQYSSNTTGLVALHPQTVGATGGGQPHDNMSPFLVTNFIISLFGIFPSPT
jgi:microcystin-dependent protein